MTAHPGLSERLLRRLASDGARTLSVTLLRERRWASALFTGVRLTVAVTGEDRIDSWLAGLADLDVSMPSYFLADANIVERAPNTATIELLLIED